jgi:hypothetical protein
MVRRIGLCTALLGGHALAGAIDQHNDGPLSGGTSIGVIGAAVNQSAAQVFTVGLEGRLDRMEAYFYVGGAPTSPLVLEVHPVSGGVPGAAVLASGLASPAPAGLQWVSFDLNAANLSIAPGQQLAMVVWSAQDLTRGEYDVEGSHDVYAGGASFYRSFSGPWMPINDYDLMFRTYVAAGGSCGSSDFNHDGDSGTDEDIESFFACIAGGCCAACGSADFDGDGDPGTDADIEAFFRVLAGGSC